MTLVHALQTDLAPIIMGFLADSHSELLETCTYLRRSFKFVWEAATQSQFSLLKVCPGLRSDITLCHRAIRHGKFTKRSFQHLLMSIPMDARTVDLIAFATAHLSGWTDEFLGNLPQTLTFCRALIEHVEPIEGDWHENIIVRYIPDCILANNRDLALACAKKGLAPFGSKRQLYIDDEEIITRFLIAHHWLPPDIVSSCRKNAWVTQDWLLDMCRHWPNTASTLLELAASSEVQAVIFESVPDALVYSTLLCVDSHDIIDRFWRHALQRDPDAIRIVGHWCTLHPSDEVLLTRFFSRYPHLYSRSHDCIRRLRYVAQVVFSLDGRLIRNSPFIQDEEMALLAVRQNGMALKWLHQSLRTNNEILMTAVRQNGLALAWAWNHSRLITRNDPVVEAAIEQNSASVVFVDE